MTRINVVDVKELCDKHLLAEHRELKRVPNRIAKGKYSLENMPLEYVLRTGHCKFFYKRLTYLKNRYTQLHEECKRRGFNVQWMFPSDERLPRDKSFWNDYTPTEKALTLSRERLSICMPANAKWTN